MNRTIKQLHKNFLILMLVMIQSSLVFADDIAIFESEKPPVAPNIMFVIDGSGSMKWAGDDQGNTRMQVLQSAMSRLISNQTEDINIGIMSFANNFNNDWRWLVHGPAYPITPIDDPAVPVSSNSYLPPVNGNESTRAYTQRVINSWRPGSGTPIVGALFEAAKYMRGENVHWGNKPADEPQAAHPASFSGTLDGSTTTVTTNIEEPCGGTTGVACNLRKTCIPESSTPVTSTPVISETPIAGQDCVDQLTTKTCAAGETFCGNATAATAATECTTVGSPASTVNQLCALPLPRTTQDCLATDPLFTRCIAHPNTIDCALATEAECLVATPGAVSCTAAVAPSVGFSCTVPVTNGGATSTIIECVKPVPSTLIATCSATEYSCTTTTNVVTPETCTHIVSSTITSSTAKYVSPITAECQSNAIILLSDGEPTVNDTSSLVASMIGANNANNCDAVAAPVTRGDWGSDESIDYYGRCGEELAEFLLKSDNGSAVDGKQAINLYTVGFNLTETSGGGRYLDKLAKAGGGQSFFADDEEGLMKAFEEAISNSNRARLFSSPAFTANPDSLLSHGDVVYLPVFNRESKAAWNGNLKKFKIKDGALVEGAGSTPNKKVMDNTGKMRADVVDMWAQGTLENAVSSGGAASRLNPSTRKVLTDSGVADGGALVELDATSVTNQQLGAADNNERSELISYITGWTDDNQPRKHMGDIIHSKPIYVDYANNKRVIFVGTNEGFLHAINDSDGTEAFAFMPTELLKNIKTQKNNPNSSDHVYGVDGEITVWKGKLKPSDATEKTILIFGLRRGGKAYYALDVTDPTSPLLLWKAVHASGKLGFSWSKPKIAKVRDKKTGGTTKNVVVFGGGYVDDNGIITKDAAGNPISEADNSGTGAAIFILDLEDGTVLLGSSGAANNSLDYAIPGGIRVMDVDANGFMDRLYFADTGGFVWRMDINTLEDIKLYKLADLSASPKRKFFNEPDTAIFKRAGRFVVSIAIGSGERPSPLYKDSEDGFFVLIDKHPGFYSTNDPFTSSDTIEIDDLLKMNSSNLNTGLDKGIFHPDNSDKKGWYYELAKGEKILNNAYTFEDKIIFTSFSANEVSGASTATTTDVCNAAAKNASQLYVLDLYSGKAFVEPKVLAPGGEITEPPLPYYPVPATANCSTNPGSCLRQPQIVLPRGGGAIMLRQNDKQKPRMYWMNHN